MTHTAHISHDAILRAQVALYHVHPTAREEVAAYRVLAQVSPLAYLPLLAHALSMYVMHEFTDRPETALALRAEAVDAARRMHSLEAGREPLLINTLKSYRVQLERMGRQEELSAVEEEIAVLEGGQRAP
ncbi:hypothetical protein [Streptomyces sp. NRRL S-378]|uniref:hypothetical protein n=1 Tax=Streptomyces sp. NRRL S-378 TaxID=1463904 RepID=UPI00131E114C|nr:hypothetical protein [Streptomyces sp. NRRL S-378]